LHSNNRLAQGQRFAFMSSGTDCAEISVKNSDNQPMIQKWIERHKINARVATDVRRFIVAVTASRNN
jgi:hypothetical protein